MKNPPSDWHMEAIGLIYDVLLDGKQLDDVKLPNSQDDLDTLTQALRDAMKTVRQLEGFVHGVRLERAVA